MNVIALLPYMVQHYEDANELCIHSAENIAAVSSEKNKKLENLATVMTLYSRRTFSKDTDPSWPGPMARHVGSGDS